MRTHAITIAETHGFMRSAEKIWSEVELAALIDHLAHNPDDGDIIPGTGGVRKLRWGKAGSGKRGGAWVIYFYYQPNCPLYLLLAYAKSKSADLSPEGKRFITAAAAALKIQRKI